MATDNRSSILVDELVPEFLETEGPKFKAFMRAYYEWLETTGQITERSKNLLNYGDVDSTDNEFIKYFQREVMADFPENILADKALLITRIKDLYRSKGSEQAYKLLFRLLYDDEIEFYYPGEDILRVSDGRWVKESSLRLAAPFTGNLYDIAGKNITGSISGATAKVDKVVATIELGIEIFEVFLLNVRGTFLDSETVTDADGNLTGTIISSVGPLQDVIIDFGGSNHRVGDTVRFISASGAGANGTVLAVDGTSIVPEIVSGGSGYTLNSTISLSGGTGTGAVFQIDSLSNTETLFSYEDTISDLRNTLINANTYVTSNSGAISANLATANASTALVSALGTANLTVGTIASMSAVTRGSDYNTVPTVTIIEDRIADQNISDGAGGIKGRNANVIAINTGGSIVDINVDNGGAGYSRIEPVTINNITRAAQNATGAGQITGVVNYNGKYIDTKGFISWNNKIQDNYYYQQFAYVLKTRQSLNTYREIVKNLLHPAGTNLFADLSIISNAAISFSSNTYIYYSVEFAIADSIQSTLQFGIPGVSYLISANSVNPTSALSADNNIVFSFALDSIEPTVIFSTDYSIDTNIGGADLISVDPTLVFGASILEMSIDTNSIASTEDFSTNASVGYNVDPVTIGTSVIFSTDYSIDTNIGGADLISIDSALIFGTTTLGLNVDPGTIVSTETLSANAVVLFTTNIFPESVNSAIVFSTDYNIDMNIGGADLISVNSALAFGTSVLELNIDSGTVVSTAVVNSPILERAFDLNSIVSSVVIPQPEVLLNVGGADLISIDSTLSMSTDHRVDQRGDGTVSNFIVNDVNDLSAQQVSDYSAFPINTFPGNRVIDGISTSFTTQLAPGTVFTIDDVGGSGEEFTLTVDIINDANTLSVTANVLYSNGDLAVISDSAYYYTV